MIRVILERPEQPASLMVFAQPVVVIGRGDTDSASPVDWQLPYPDVSRRHCRLSCAGGQRFVEGLSDRSPTYVNGRKVQGMTAIAAGDEIRFGYCVVRVCEDVAVAPPAPAKATVAPARATAPAKATVAPAHPAPSRPAPTPTAPLADAPDEARSARFVAAPAAIAEPAPAIEGDVSLLVERARHWDLRGQPTALLLTGSLLQRGRAWSRVGPELGEVGGLMRLYVERSVRAQRSRLRRLGLAAGVTLTTALTGSAIAQAWLPELRIPELPSVDEAPRARCREDVLARADALTSTALQQGDDAVALLLTSRALQDAAAGGCRNLASAEPTLRELLAKRHSRLLDRREGPIQDAVVRRDGRYVAAADAGGHVTIWDVQGRRAAAPLDDGGVPAHVLAWSRDDRWLATGTAAGEVIVWDVQEPAQAVMQPRLAGHHRPIDALAFSPEGGLLASADADELRLWDMGGDARGDARGRYTGLAGPTSQLHFNAGASRLFGLGEDGKVRIWPIAPAGPEERLGKPGTLPADGHIVAMAVNLDGTQIVTGDRSGVVLVWRLRGNTWRSSAGTTHEGEIAAIHLVPGRDRFLSLAKDRTLTLVDLGAARGKQVQPPSYALGPLQNPARHLVVEPSGRRALTVDDTGVAELWNLETQQKQSTRFAEQPRQVTVVTGTSAQSVVITGEVDGSLRVWDLMLEGGSAGSHLLSEHRGGTPELALSHEGHTLVSTTRGKNIQVWNLDGAMVPTLNDIRTASRPVEIVAVSANGRWVAGASGNFVLVWDLEKRDRNAAPANLVEHADAVMHLQFSVDGEWLVSADLRGSVRTWAINAAGPELASKHAVEHPPSVHALAVSREHVAVGTGGSKDTRGEVFAWQLGESGKGNDRAVWDHAGAAHRLTFDATGSYLASGSADGGVRIGKLGDDGFTVDAQYSHGQSVSALAFTALPGNGVALASGARDGEVLITTPTDPQGGSPRKLAQREGEITGLAFGVDPGLLFIGGEDGAALLQMEGTRTRTIALAGHRGAIVALHTDVVGRVVVTVGDDQTLRAWPLEVSALQHIACSFVGRNLRAEELPADLRPTAEPQCPAR
ncbi:MAG TPA: FHA domain-containing protein [Nannocystis sp.]